MGQEPNPSGWEDSPGRKGGEMEQLTSGLKSIGVAVLNPGWLSSLKCPVPQL